MKLYNKYSEEILNSLTSGIVTINKNFEITFVNESAENIIGLKKEKIIGKICNTICKDDNCENNCPIALAIDTGKKIHDFDTQIKTATKGIVPVKLNAAVLKNKENIPVGGVISFRIDPTRTQHPSKVTTIDQFNNVIGNSRKMKNLLSLISEISFSNAPVLITGETGVGKEVIVDSIHKTSQRSNSPLVKVNCSVIPPTLFGSELFGHVKGAFTDAKKDRIGRFELADNGTIFLDEIAEMPLNMQSQLLRVLQNGSFEKVGDSNTVKVDVRVIAATNKNLTEAIANNTFRKDLFYRLNVIPIEVPPLRDRKEDIPYLILHFISKLSPKYGKMITEIDDEALDLLMKYNWPGNIRELENTIEYGIIRSKKTSSICICGLPPKFRENIDCINSNNLKSLRNSELQRLLIENNFNKSLVAKTLGINRTTLWRWLKNNEN